MIEVLTDIFSVICERAPGDEVLRSRNDDGEWSSTSVKEFRRGVFQRARALAALSVQPQQQVAVISENRPEWHMYDFAILGLGATTVPIHANMSPEQTAFILEDSETTHLIVSDETHLSRVLKGQDGVDPLKKIIVMDPPDTIPKHDVLGEPELLKHVEEDTDEQLASFWNERTASITPDTLATLIYTSGTTGVPKGVMLTHGNIAANIRSCHKVLTYREEDVGLSFLPLSHAFERLIDYAYLFCGATVAYSSPDTVVDDLEEVQPTVMASVPRLYEKLKINVEEKVEGGLGVMKKMFQWALRVGRTCTELKHVHGQTPSRWMRVKQWIANHLILRPIHERLGKNLRFVISGGAALDEDVCEFLFGLSIPVLEGYGMTEMSPVVSFNRPDAIRPGTVGTPVPDVDVRIAEDGEILTRGPNMMKGYYRRYEESVRAMKDGWFHTGDRGEIDDDGYLIVKGRTKFTIVTSWGENVEPQPLERELRQSPFIEHALMIGDDRKFISALLQPDFERLYAWAEKEGIDFDDRGVLLEDERVRSHYSQLIEEMQSDWSDYEKIKEFAFIPETLTVKKGYLTPTMKIRRHVVQDTYRDLIEHMYDEQNPS